MRPTVVVGLVVAAAAAAVGGAQIERWRHRQVEPCERDRWDTERTELVDLNIDLRHQLADAQAEIAAYREAFPLAALSIDRQRSVN